MPVFMNYPLRLLRPGEELRLDRVYCCEDGYLVFPRFRGEIPQEMASAPAETSAGAWYGVAVRGSSASEETKYSDCSDLLVLNRQQYERYSPRGESQFHGPSKCNIKYVVITEDDPIQPGETVTQYFSLV